MIRPGRARSSWLTIDVSRPARLRLASFNSFCVGHWPIRAGWLSASGLFGRLPHELLFDDRLQAGIAHGPSSFNGFARRGFSSLSERSRQNTQSSCLLLTAVSPRAVARASAMAVASVLD